MTTNAFDLNDLRVDDETRDLPIRHPASGEDIATITLYHVDAPIPREIKRKQERRRIKNFSGGFKLDPNEMEQDALDLLAACTKSWERVTWKGELLVCNKANVRMLYESVPWLRRQVSDCVNDVSFFLENSESDSPSSSPTGSV